MHVLLELIFKSLFEDWDSSPSLGEIVEPACMLNFPTLRFRQSFAFVQNYLRIRQEPIRNLSEHAPNFIK